MDELFDFCVEYSRGQYNETVWYERVTREQLKAKIDREMKRGSWYKWVVKAVKKVGG